MPLISFYNPLKTSENHLFRFQGVQKDTYDIKICSVQTLSMRLNRLLISAKTRRSSLDFISDINMHLERLISPIKTDPYFCGLHSPYDGFKTFPLPLPLCSSKSHKYNNYDKAPYKDSSNPQSPQANLFPRLFPCH